MTALAERIRAIARTLADSGDITPAGARALTALADDIEPCTHCRDNPPKGHTCPACGRQTP